MVNFKIQVDAMDVFRCAFPAFMAVVPFSAGQLVVAEIAGSDGCPPAQGSRTP
jgi:hypothetical protein